MINRMTPIVVGTLALGFAQWVQAEDYFVRKPGLWRLQMAGNQIEMCVGADTDALLAKKARDSGVMKNCSNNESQSVGNQFIHDSACKFSFGDTVSHSVTTFSGSEGYHTTIEQTVKGKAHEPIVQDAKWIGPCPSDYKPGDQVMILNGQRSPKMNVLQTLQLPGR